MTVAFSSYYALISTVIFLRMRNEERPSKNLSGNAEEIADFARPFSRQYQIYATVFWGKRIQLSYLDIFVLPDTICFVG